MKKDYTFSNTKQNKAKIIVTDINNRNKKIKNDLIIFNK